MATAKTTAQSTDIREYAHSLYAAHGEKSLAEAAQRAREFEKNGNQEEARNWRRIEQTLQEIRGPRQS
ncbi:MAG: hypothetical protein AB7T86_11415 [Xanthobacteraceae bacterium]|jgi:hypothetical protein|uniref:hypothetical protein n=1 Tax=Pseudolabrys sp. TaxID=1960880 RepID=UPI003D1478B3